MESQPQNPEFRINPENFHPCIVSLLLYHISRFLSISGMQKYREHTCFFIHLHLPGPQDVV